MSRLSCVIAAAAVFAIAGLASGGAAADPYKWCAEYSGGDTGGATNCGFVTLEQCQATIRGMGGSCSLNPFYTGPENEPVIRKRKVRRY